MKNWLPVGCLALAAFVYITSELLPIGLLPEISEGINESTSKTGLLLTGYAWIVAVVSLPLTLLTARLNRKPLLIILLLFFCIGCLLATAASTFMGIFVPRIFIAFSHGIFWSITAPLAVRLSPNGKHAIGLGIISAGVALGTVLGVPIATYLGQLFTWHAAFWFIAGVSAAIALVLFFILPTLPSENAGSLKSLPALARNKTLIAAYVVTICVVTAHYSTYTYLSPYLRQVIGVSPYHIVRVLLIYGITGTIGIFLASKYMDRYLKYVVISAVFVIFAVFLMLVPVHSIAGTVALLVFWSIAMSALGVSMQSWILRLAPESADAAISIYSSLFNVGIGSGALLGGIIVAKADLAYISYAGALFIIPALVLFFFLRKAFIPSR